MRADARKNYEQLLDVARSLFIEQGADASLRDVARKAEVGLGTLYRHFPTREALFDALLRESFDTLSARATELEASASADEALLTWFHEIVAVTHSHRGVIAPMVAAIAAPDSALHASCVVLKTAGAALLARAQSVGTARHDLDGEDLFALVSALAWLRDQPPFASRADHLFEVVTSALFDATRKSAARSNTSSRTASAKARSRSR